MTGRPIARQRVHTLHFLAEIRSSAPVFLDTEVDMTAILAHRDTSARRYSLVGYVLSAAARTLTKYPEANAAIAGRTRARVVRYPTVTGKLALDRALDGHRVVLSALLPELDRLSLDEIQDRVEHYRDGDPATMPEFAGVRTLHRLPWALRVLAYRISGRALRNRASVFGTLAVSSLGHRPVDGFHSVGGTTITLGVGRVTDRPVVRDGQIVIAPVLRLNLTFDHRVIDGAEAADYLADLKEALESFAAPAGQPGAAVAGEVSR